MRDQRLNLSAGISGAGRPLQRHRTFRCGQVGWNARVPYARRIGFSHSRRRKSFEGAVIQPVTPDETRQLTYEFAFGFAAPKFGQIPPWICFEGSIGRPSFVI